MRRRGTTAPARRRDRPRAWRTPVSSDWRDCPASRLGQHAQTYTHASCSSACLPAACHPRADASASGASARQSCRQARIESPGGPSLASRRGLVVARHENGRVVGLRVLAHGPAGDDERVLVAPNLLELRTDVEQFQMGHAITTSSRRRNGDERRTARARGASARRARRSCRAWAARPRAAVARTSVCDRRGDGGVSAIQASGGRSIMASIDTRPPRFDPRLRARCVCGQRRVRAANQQRRPLRRRRSAEHGRAIGASTGTSRRRARRRHGGTSRPRQSSASRRWQRATAPATSGAGAEPRRPRLARQPRSSPTAPSIGPASPASARRPARRACVSADDCPARARVHRRCRRPGRAAGSPVAQAAPSPGPPGPSRSRAAARSGARRTAPDGRAVSCRRFRASASPDARRGQSGAIRARTRRASANSAQDAAVRAAQEVPPRAAPRAPRCGACRIGG